MVGLFNLGNKSSPSRPATASAEPLSSDSAESLAPPPPYKEAPTPSLVMTEITTTTEVITTTQTTTHFFSLPLWRKRAAPASVHDPASVHMQADESGFVSRPGTNSRLPIVDKALPPTPPNEPQLTPFPTQLPEQVQPNGLTSHASHLTISDEGRRSRSSSRPSSPVQRPQLEPRKSTTALAQAALGVGLPAIMPQVAASSSKSDANTVALLSTPVPQNKRAGVRRAKSTHKIKENTHPDVPYASDSETSFRARNISFTASSLLPFTPDVKGKGKGKERASAEEIVFAQSTKTITRRPSFWSRRKQTSTKRPPTREQSPVESTSPTLPVLPPFSPFSLDGRITTSPEPQDKCNLHRPAISPNGPMRRRSISVTPPAPEAPNRSRGPTSPPSRRPMTADSWTTSPTRSSFFITQSPTVDSPLSSPLLEIEPGSSFPLKTDATTQRRPRAQTNPPILHRLSLNLFSLTPSTGPSLNQSHSSPLASARASPRPSLTKRPADVPRPQEDEESPEVYLARLRAAVSKAEIAGVLASSADPFHVRALRAYLEEFNFMGDPLDVALRKLLMDVGLPRETQQIDRVMEAFAARYMHCNPDLYTSEDHPYILAFSLIMLHTDAFNKSNKRKMTKADYIKNTRLPGVAAEVLDCFYDNIVFAPFIFIEDPLDVNGQRGLVPDAATNRLSSVSTLATATNGITTPTSRSNKVDPYFLITNDSLDPLRVRVESYVPMTNPYSYEGTSGPWDTEELRRAFAKASVLEVGVADPLRSSPFFGLSVGGAPSPLLGNMSAFPEVLLPSGNEVWTLKVAKVALLNRKDDLLSGGKKAMNRKWRPWSVILTGSQLLFFRDPSWATTLVAQSETTDGQIIYPHASIFKPDELYSVKDTIAVHDKSYIKRPYTLRLAMPDARQFLLQTDDERELNAWLSRINYASAFKSAGVRMRSLGMSNRDVQLAGVAAATSHLHDMQHQSASSSTRSRQSGETVLRDVAASPNGVSPTRRPKRSVTLMSDRSDLDMDVPRAPEVEGADQLKATFDQVKAELAAGHRQASETNYPHSPIESHDSRTFATSQNPRVLSRSQIIMLKIRDLDSKISATQTQLDADLRFVRNVAILAPFQKATRDRLELAVQGLTRRVMQARLDIARFCCHRDVLSDDLTAEMEDWQRTKTMAMKAAAETLRSKTVPRMTLSFHDEEEVLSPIPVDSKWSSSSTHRPESSICESFHSAIDFGPDWPSYEDTGSSGLLSTSRLFDSPGRQSSSSLRSFSAPESESSSKSLPDPPSPAISQRSSPNIASPRSSTDTHNHEKFYTAHETLAEEAEDWNKTKCAQRVSLVRLPSDLRLSTLFDKHQRSPRPS